ncbi:hypothetical protein EYW98_23165 [Escherichia coli]|uniref:hypothetical protein n=1 Tax=Escherichia sp. MOD1-EC7003 TaxID=2093900 RepID=UPI000CF77EE9|nr:hypothetical protein [Escherichia sp. MOD1-EC7003]EGO8362171.1 hypothetical protein [Escherichia coli]EGO8379662.1 hypothetical protein [Escherichia coli]MCH0695053.1 hypothetical protein [Escherichia coli]
MNRILPVLALAFVFCCSPLFAQPGWNVNGAPINDEASRRSADGFGGMVMITSDADWQEKWATPAENVPKFTEAKVVHLGESLFILTFLTNPKLDEQQEANVKCSFQVVRPDGVDSMNEKEIDCFNYHFTQPVGDTLYLSDRTMGFHAEKGDPKGVWTVRVTLKDTLRTTPLELVTHFTLE